MVFETLPNSRRLNVIMMKVIVIVLSVNAMYHDQGPSLVSSVQE